jgi:hypothetical protein
MFDVETRPRSLFGDDAEPVANKCKRDNIISASETDWMEWQAGYVCGAILIPASALIDTVQVFRRENGLALSNLALNSEASQRLIETVAARFRTSKDAARVRLLKKRILTDTGLVHVGDIFRDGNLF